ncbi:MULTISPECIES: hypothetical protein [Butyrivibrio]|uniref:hypothetical protein n=1 Tax=Butyrivibrio TaxID=830 RepID=UPI0018CAC38E|nr:MULTISPECIES: hypothetical protein [Butyrivibrio]
MRRVSRKEEAREMSFWEKERKSNNVRRKSLENLDYICIPVDVLPFGTSGSNKELENSEQNVLALKDEKIVNLTGITNTDLKLEYGTANITELSLYDQNYTALVRALQNWGKALYDAGRYEDSAKVLEFAVKTRSDITATYKLLIDMYKTKLFLSAPEIEKKINSLIPIADNLNSLSRLTILKLLGCDVTTDKKHASAHKINAT